jgi:hypothetical protein
MSKNNVFRYENCEDEGLVSIFVGDTLITELSDENGDAEAVFNWFVKAYSSANFALNYSCTGECKTEENKIKADAVMEFVNIQLGAFESNFVETNQVSLYSMYRFAQHHVKDNYEQETKNLADVYSVEFANECRSTEELTQ